MIALVGRAGFGAPGSYSLRLRTDAEPYAVVVSVTRPDKPVDATSFSRPATVLLGTVGNLDTVEVWSADGTYTLTAAQASKALGYDVKSLGRDAAALERYLTEQDD